MDRSPQSRPVAIDLFSGCGGMTFGLRRAGFRVLAALEVDPVAAEVYRLNHPRVRLKEADIRTVDAAAWMHELGLRPGELDLLAGCPPCQGFSRLRTKNGARRNNHPHNRLLDEMGRMVESFLPKAVLMENVPGLRSRAVFNRFVARLERLGYKPRFDCLDAQHFGVPQRRRRLVLVAGKGVDIPFGDMSRRRVTVRQALSGLPPAGSSGDLLHDMPERRTPAMMKLIRAVPKDGGSRTDLPDEYQRPCHRRTSGFKDVYGRMSWDKPAPTITGGCYNPSKGRFLHPEEDRNITLREAAILQSLPRSFTVPPNTNKTAAALLIGNALPPRFVERHARAIRQVLTGEGGTRGR